MTMHSNLTSKGQVTIPKPIRDALGLHPGAQVEFVVNDRGETVIRAANAEESRERREREILQRIAEARSRFRAQDPMPGMSTEEYMLWVRGPAAEI